MKSEKTYTIALAGNPNVGKSTIFNALTKLHQHTGNWAGKTVACASGRFSYKEAICHVVDLPGIYSLRTHSEEEEIAREYICSGDADLLLVVCDATCLERGLHLLKQITELDREPLPSVILCVNLCDEASKKGITVDFERLSQLLQIPVIPCMARKRHGLDRLKEEILTHYMNEKKTPALPCSQCCESGSCPFSSMLLHSQNIGEFSPEQLSSQTVFHTKPGYRSREERLDRLVTGRFTGTVIMLLLLAVVFWLTITGANYPSAFLWDQFYRLEQLLAQWFEMLHAPLWLTDALVYGVFRVVAWIVSVMLPPMAIFFPLFTLLEDLGYLPRVAFNMDCAFKRCHACGKQCLTMCMVNS